MGAAKYLIGLRNDIDDLVNESFRKREGGALSTDDILKEVKRRLKPQISAAESDLIDIALKRLIDSVGRRKAGRRKAEGERDLFGDYPNIPQMLTIGEKKRKRTAKLSIGEALDYLDTHSPKAVSERYEAIRRLVDDCLPFKTSDDQTIEELLELKKQSTPDGSKSVFGWSRPVASSAASKEPALAQ